MFPRRRPNRIFTAPRSCFVFDGTSSVVYYELLKPTETITGDRYRRGIRTLLEKWQKIVANDGQYFES